MRILIDGYNLMHAVVLSPGRRLGPDSLRKLRHRFLNDLADLLDPVDAHQTTIVFDAAAPPEHLPRQTRHKGLTVQFTGPDEEADERIEQLIARHSAPKLLRVVSSDHRIRQAGRRRRAQVVTADDFWAELKARRARKQRPGDRPPVPSPDERARLHGLSPEESARWQAEFRHVAELPEAREAFSHADFVPTDEDIARIAREVEDEDSRR